MEKASRENRQELLKRLEEEEAILAGLEAKAKAEDPFWYWCPTEGRIDDAGREILRRYLKEEDIPEKVNSQLDRLLSTAEINGTSGGNRSGKTDVETVDGLIKSTGELPDSLRKYEKHFEAAMSRARQKVIRGRVTGVDNKQLNRVVLPTWQNYVPRKYLKSGTWESSYSKEFDILTLYRNKKPCATIEFMTNEQSTKSGQGNDLDWGKFDEEPDKGKWKETLMRFGTADRLDISMAWTPTKGLTWATDLFHTGLLDNESTDKSTALFKLTPIANPYVKRDTLVKIMDDFAKVSTYDELRMRLLGDAISLSGLVYSGLFDNRLHIKDPFFEKLTDKSEYLVLYGADPHTVTPSAIVFVLVDKEGICYIDRCISGQWDTDEIKFMFWKTVNEHKYRMGWGAVDKSSNSDNMAFGGRNIFKEITRPTYRQGHRSENVAGYDPNPQMMIKALPALRESQKFEGSIRAGVDEIKRRLREPVRLYVINRPENRDLIQSFQTLERDTYRNEDMKGQKDRIQEGKHHFHAALRYIFQFPVNWYPPQISVPEFQYLDEGAFL